MRYFVLMLMALIFAVPVMAQETEPPTQIEYAIGNLSQRLGEDITIDDLNAYQWFEREFADASLGCPQPGQLYAQVVTLGYQFLLTYDGTVYDYRVSDNGELVTLCDTRAAFPTEPPAQEAPPREVCGEEYVVQEGDTLSEIAVGCNTTVAAMMNANPSIGDPSLIFTGNALTIPETQPMREVSIRPDSGPPGTTLTVFVSGFPSGAQVQLGLGPPESEYDVVATREIGDDGELVATLTVSPQIQPPNERVAVVVLDNEETISEVFTVTEGQVEPTPAPTEPADDQFTQSQMYLVALGDEGRSGVEFGCGDSIVPVTINFEPTPAPLTAALEEMFAYDSRTYGQSGLYNVFYQSDLTVDGINIENGEATINLSGTLQVGGVCDTPRVIEQIEATATQYFTIDSVSIFLNGEPIQDSM